jgi:hypothetical protein
MAFTRAAGLGLRALEFLFTLLVVALVGHVVSQAFAGNPASVNYAMFAGVFSLLTLFYLIPATWNESIAGHPLAPVVVDLLNVIFTLTAGIGLAAGLDGVHSCEDDFYLAVNEVTNGSLFDPTGRCHEAQAATAFLWFAWACYTASLVLSVLDARSTTI